MNAQDTQWACAINRDVYALERGQKKLFAQMDRIEKELAEFFTIVAANELGKVTDATLREVVQDQLDLMA